MASTASSDEGEIRDSADKATTTLPRSDSISVDRQGRTQSSHSTSKSPEHRYGSRDVDSAERVGSDRPPHGSKRVRGDDYPDRSRGDPRSFKIHYEDGLQNSRRSRVSYEDIDRGSTQKSDLPYDDRDRYPSKRPRTRSRSPYRSSRRGGTDNSQSRQGGGYTDTSRPYSSYGRGDVRARDTKDQSVSNRGQSPLPADNARQEAKTMQGSSQQSSSRSDEALESEK